MAKFGFKNRDDFHAWLKKGTVDLGNVGAIFRSLLGKYVGTNLTGAEEQANAFTAQQNQEAMAFEERMADKQMAFQAEQAATQWQRGVQDMQAAGLNPALAYGQGGASAMSGSSGAGHPGSSVTPGVGSLSDLIQLATLKPTIENMQAEARNRRAEARLKEIDAKTRGRINEQTLAMMSAEISSLKESASLTKFQRTVIGPLEEAIKKYESSSKSVQALYDNWRKEFYDANHYWPSDNAESFFFNFVQGVLADSVENSDGIPFFAGESDRLGVRGF